MLIYLYILGGVNCNYVQGNHLVRINELRCVLERLRSDYEVIMDKDKGKKLLNKSFKDAQLYFNYVKEDFGEEKCKKIVNQ